MKSLTTAAVTTALAELEVELGEIGQQLDIVCQALPAPLFEIGSLRPLNAAAEILTLFATLRREALPTVRLRLRRGDPAR